MRKPIIILGIFITTVVGAVVIYGLINLFKKYKHTKALAARTFMDIEAQTVAVEKRSLHRVLSQINVSNTPLVPSFQPVGPREKQVQAAPIVSVLQVNKHQHSETPIHTSLARLPVGVTRSRNDSKLVTKVPVPPPPVVAQTANHRKLVRSPAIITMCDRYPTLASSSPLPFSEPVVVPSSNEKPLPTTAAEAGFVKCEHHDGSTAVTVSPSPPTTAVETPKLYMIDECEKSEQDGSGIVTDPTDAADANIFIDTDIIVDADIFGSLLAFRLS